MTEEILNKLNKLKALADRGVGGEKTNAEELLEKLLRKYKLTEEELIEDTISKHEFQFWGELGESLFHQIVYKVLGSRAIVYHYVYKRNCKTRFVKCTNAEALEIKELFEFYRHHLDEGFKTYYRAFINAEDIFPEVEDPSIASNKPVDDKVYQMARILDKHDRHLKIEGPVN